MKMDIWRLEKYNELTIHFKKLLPTFKLSYYGKISTDTKYT